MIVGNYFIILLAFVACTLALVGGGRLIADAPEDQAKRRPMSALFLIAGVALGGLVTVLLDLGAWGGT